VAGKGQNSRPPATLAEPRTDREQHVLRYLASTLSNAEIASEFYLSINTVKTHQRMVYRKLAPTDGVTLCAARRNCACSDRAAMALRAQANLAYGRFRKSGLDWPSRPCARRILRSHQSVTQLRTTALHHSYPEPTRGAPATGESADPRR